MQNATLKSKGRAHLSTSLTVPNGHVTTSKEQAADRVTTSIEQPADHVTTSKEKLPDLPASMEDHQIDETELNSAASETSIECDFYSLSCSALPDKTSANELYDQDVPQSLSAPQLTQREHKELEGQDGDQEKPVQELVNPVLDEDKPIESGLDQELPVEQDGEEAWGKSKLEEPVRPDEMVQQDQEKQVKPEIEQKGSELAQKVSEATNNEEAAIEHTLAEGEQDREERDRKPGDEISEPIEISEDRNDITIASDDVTTKYETAEVLAIKARHGEGDASTDEGVQVNSNVQASSATIESRGDGDETATGDGGDGKVQSDGEEECSQADSQQESAHNENLLEDSHTSLSLEVEEKEEAGVDGNTQNDSPSSHKSSEIPPTIPEATPPSSEIPPTSSESPLKEESLPLGENSPSHSDQQAPPQINPTASMDTKDLQIAAGQTSQLAPASIETGTPLSDVTHDSIDTHCLDTTPNTEPSSTPEKSPLPEREKSADSFAQSQDPPTLEEPPVTKLFSSSPDNSMSTEREKRTVSSPEPPWSPNTASLARDVQDLLSAVQAPLEAEQMVRVPSISRNNRYYRVSVKGSTPKASRRGLEEGSTPQLNRHGQEVSYNEQNDVNFLRGPFD